MSETWKTIYFLGGWATGSVSGLGIASYFAGRSGECLRDYFKDDARTILVILWPVGALILLIMGIGFFGEKGATAFARRFKGLIRWITTPWRRLHSLGNRHRDKKQDE